MGRFTEGLDTVWLNLGSSRGRSLPLPLLQRGEYRVPRRPRHSGRGECPEGRSRRGAPPEKFETRAGLKLGPLLELLHLKLFLHERRTQPEWAIATFGMLGGRDQGGETMVKYLTSNFGKEIHPN